jgi:hypothetical protein
MPYATFRREQMCRRSGRFVHYTSAENALSIIESKQIWMRNATCMTDYTELGLGHQLLLKFFTQQENKNSFYSALNTCYEGVAEEAVNLFDQWWKNNIPFRTYIACVSEHDDTEDVHGRLSMWRAFGRVTARAAIVLRLPAPGEAEGLEPGCLFRLRKRRGTDTQGHCEHSSKQGFSMFVGQRTFTS